VELDVWFPEHNMAVEYQGAHFFSLPSLFFLLFSSVCLPFFFLLP
jgi:hypothetical protein